MIDPELKERVGEKIQGLLKELAEEEGFREYKIQKTSDGAKGDGYMGVITSVSIVGTTASKEKKDLHVIVKSAPTDDFVRAFVPVREYFAAESYMYNSVLPEFDKFIAEREAAPFSGLAKCYKTCLEDKSEAFVFEDLKEAGYGMWNRKIPMDHDHLSLAMREFGRLHALSFALRDQHPDRFKELADGMGDFIAKFMCGPEIMKMFKLKAEKSCDALDPVVDKHALEVFKAVIDKLETYFLKLVTSVDENSIIVHGDGWVNNMLFKYDDTTDPKKLTQMCLLDFQQSRLGPTIVDLAYFFYTSANRTSLDNYQDYLDIYYQSLDDYMRALGSDAEKLYPKSLFLQQWNEYAAFGLLTSLLMIHNMLIEMPEALDLSELANSGQDMMEAFGKLQSNPEEYNNRIRPIILHFVNNKFI